LENLTIKKKKINKNFIKEKKTTIPNTTPKKKTLTKKKQKKTMSDYEQRAKTFHLADETTLRNAIQDQRTVVLDVRNDQEVSEAGRFQPDGLAYHHVSCTPTDATDLTNRAGSLFPNKDVPIVVYCRSGRRAATAKQALEEQGYTHVLNAGGHDDILAMKL
jgi:phage shock protein E